MLKGTITALVTPMKTNGAIDFESLKALLESQINAGINGVVVFGTTGETQTLTIAEKLEILQFVINIANNQIKIIAGVSGVNSDEMIQFITQLNNFSGVHFLLIATPYYVKPTQNGLYLHYKLLASKTQIPIILYNVPSRTCCDLLNDTIIKLSIECKNIVALKDATGDIARLTRLRKKIRNNFSLLSGDDATALAFILCGGHGVISVTSNVAPVTMCKFVDAALKMQIATAINFNDQLLDLHEILFLQANPIVVKWVLFYLNKIQSDFLRLPLTPLSHDLQNTIKTILQDTIYV